eukprot:GFYU01000406.1.p1 GENE.GFYU01000406.1~~GFYU01000406.1.p1  ORF type:complete len:392 (+),score=130.35 GFYU01000406.1:72-1178(+)
MAPATKHDDIDVELLPSQLKGVRIPEPPKVELGQVTLKPEYVSTCCSKKIAVPQGGPSLNSDPIKNISIKKVYLAYNPYSGNKKGQKRFEEAQSMFTAAGVTVDPLMTKYAGHPEELAREVDLDGYDVYCVIGGDGTIGQTMNGMVTRKDGKMLPLGMIPGGTGNTFLYDHGIKDTKTAVEIILKGNVHAVDCIKSEFSDFEDAEKRKTLYAINLVSRDTVNRMAEKMRWMGPARYDVAVVKDIVKNKPPRTKLVVDGEDLDVPLCPAIVVQNNKYCGAAYYMAPYAAIDDGVSDLFVLVKGSVGEALGAFGEIKTGRHIYHKNSRYYKFKNLTLECDTREDINVDGEVVGTTPLKLETMAGRWLALF